MYSLKTSTEVRKNSLTPRYNQLLIDRYSDTTFLIRQITKNANNSIMLGDHISDHPNMTIDTYQEKQNREIFSTIYNFLFSLTESQDIKQLKKLLPF